MLPDFHFYAPATSFRRVKMYQPSSPASCRRSLRAPARPPPSPAKSFSSAAFVAILIYTAARAGAVASLHRGSLYHSGEQWMLHFDEKGGKSREIPVRHDLETMLFEYIEAAAIGAGKDSPLFRTAYRKTGQLTEHMMSELDVCRMVKRRLRAAGLPSRLSPHSFRVTTITDLLEQGVPLEDVQRLAGHADPRTTRLYDRRDKKIPRNIVERISI